MSKFEDKRRCGQILWFAAMGLLLAGGPGWADTGVVVARVSKISSQMEAYARVEPITVVKLKAAAEGVIAGLKVLPGETVEAGTEIARLKGPAIEALLTQRRNALASAQAAQVAARKAFIIERQKKAEQLSTQQAVSQARAALAQAQAQLHTARSRLQAAQATVALKAPTAGTVLALTAAGGERVQPGQTILTLQPAGALWLEARYCGSAAATVQVGMSGRFVPASGASAIPVKVRSIIGAIGPDGGQPVGLMATVPAPNWRSGEASTVMLWQERIALNRSMGFPSRHPVPLQADIRLPDVTAVPPLNKMLAGIDMRRLDLIALKKGYNSQQARVRAAIFGQFPRITLGFSHGRDTDNVVSTGPALTIDLPFFDRNQGQIAIARATRKQLFDEYLTRLFEARSNVAKFATDIRSINREITAMKQYLPALRHLVKTYHRALLQGNADVLTHYNARDHLIATRLALLNLQLVDQFVTLEIASGQYLGHPQAE